MEANKTIKKLYHQTIGRRIAKIGGSADNSVRGQVNELLQLIAHTMMFVGSVAIIVCIGVLLCCYTGSIWLGIFSISFMYGGTIKWMINQLML